MRPILVTGGNGQVGTALRSLRWPADIVLHAPARAELDLANPASIEAAFDRHAYAAILSVGAYTAVDDAERAPAAAFAANALGPAALAACSARSGVPIVHVSTDYVFDGSKDGSYPENAPLQPLGVYGASKAAGEFAVASANSRHAIVRTAWVVSATGRNFVKTMLDLATRRPVVRVVDDQSGCPTAAADLAAALQTIALGMLDDPAAPCGTFHFVNAGEATWFDLAAFVYRRAAECGAPAAVVEPVSTADYGAAAPRPRNSRLSCARIAATWGVEPRPWQDAVAEIVAELLPPA